MKNNHFENENQQTEFFDQMVKNRNKGKIIGGLFLTGIGIVLLAKELGMFIPEWIFSWPMLLVVIGLFIGAKHRFQKTGWLVLVLLGASFLVRNFFPEYNVTTYILPIILIIVGVYVIIKPRRNYFENKINN